MSHRRDQIRSQLLADMASQMLRPGDQIRIDSWSKRIRLSAIPVREEFWRLTGEGLLVARPGAGFYVPRLHADDLVQLYRVRRLILAAALNRLVLPLSFPVELDACAGEPRWFDRLGDLLVGQAQDHALADIWYRTTLRLAPYVSSQSAAGHDEQVGIAAGLAAHGRAGVRKAMTALLRRREREAAMTVRRADPMRTARI